MGARKHQTKMDTRIKSPCAKAALCNFGRRPMWRGERGMENWVMHVGLSEKRRYFPLLSVTVPIIFFAKCTFLRDRYTVVTIVTIFIVTFTVFP